MPYIPGTLVNQLSSDLGDPVSSLQVLLPQAMDSVLGYKQQDISGSTASYTLTDDESRGAFFRFTGARSANCSVTLNPGGARLFTVQNSTTGSFTLLLRVTTGGRGLFIPQGATVLCWHDGLHLYGHTVVVDEMRGLRVEWLSTTSLRVKTGAAYIPGSGLATVAQDIDVTGLSLAANTMYHVYLWWNTSLNGGNGGPAVEVVTTAPVKYFGRASQKTNDTTRRYLISVATGGAGQLFRFEHQPDNSIRYVENVLTAPFRVLSGGGATSATSVSCSAVVPITSNIAYCRLVNVDPSAIVLFGNTAFPPAPGTIGIEAIIPNDQSYGRIPLVGQAFQYMYHTAPSAGNCYVDVLGYDFER